MALLDCLFCLVQLHYTGDDCFSPYTTLLHNAHTCSSTHTFFSRCLRYATGPPHAARVLAGAVLQACAHALAHVFTLHFAHFARTAHIFPRTHACLRLRRRLSPHTTHTGSPLRDHRRVYAFSRTISHPFFTPDYAPVLLRRTLPAPYCRVAYRAATCLRDVPCVCAPAALAALPLVATRLRRMPRRVAPILLRCACRIMHFVRIYARIPRNFASYNAGSSPPFTLSLHTLTCTTHTHTHTHTHHIPHCCLPSSSAFRLPCLWLACTWFTTIQAYPTWFPHLPTCSAWDLPVSLHAHRLPPPHISGFCLLCLCHCFTTLPHS